MNTNFGTRKNEKMLIRSFLSWFFLVLVFQVQAQIELTPEFRSLLDSTGLGFIFPLEGKYKATKAIGAQYEHYDFAIRSRKEGIEIRYAVYPYDEKDFTSIAPHAATMRLVTHLASNDEEAMISALSIAPDEIAENYNADWAKLFFFQPKGVFSSAKQCKLLAIHREGSGTAFVLFLFDKSSIELDNRTLALRFEENTGAEN